MAVIDVHCHLVPPRCLPMEAVAPDGRTYGLRLGRDAQGAPCPVVNGQPNRNCDPEQLWNLERRLRDMDAAGVEVQVLSPPPFLLFYALPSHTAQEYARRFNAALAEITTARPDRFRGMATVPLQDPERAAAELEYAITELGLHGVEIGTNVNGLNLDEPRFAPFFETVQRLAVPVFVHPHAVAGQERLQRYYLGNLIGNPLDTTICIASLIFGGVLDAFPGLKLIFAHGGGQAPYLVGRWDRGHAVRPECQALPQPPSAYLQRLYFDTLCHRPQALHYLLLTVGASRLVLGTDYPFDMGDPQPQATLAALPAAERAAVAGETAARLYGIGDGAGRTPASKARSTTR
ncbi:MAG: 2-hydroxy-3-carboxy-6-oxo-7-methylocta-2,4-dienoate decarboxylase [Candidatus Tectimicrobiota bacterium]|nr:MAG: 2-hydroxy-3-carboxy-6-oxo-7-methylocta-2,4-dienoate decarboxylase [Candidatus Tectomicrobia bacterium]